MLPALNLSKKGHLALFTQATRRMGILSPAFVNRQAVSAPTASPRSHTCNGEFFRFVSHEHKYDGSIGQPGPLTEASAGYLRPWSMGTYAICQGKHQVHSPPFLPHTHHPEFFPDGPHGSKCPLYATKRRSHPSISDTQAISAHTHSLPSTPYPPIQLQRTQGTMGGCLSEREGDGTER